MIPLFRFGQFQTLNARFYSVGRLRVGQRLLARRTILFEGHGQL